MCWTFTALVDWRSYGPIACPRSTVECCRALFWWRSVAADPCSFRLHMSEMGCMCCKCVSNADHASIYIPQTEYTRGMFSSVLVLVFVFAFRFGSHLLATTVHPPLPPRRGVRGALMSGDSWVSYFTPDDESSETGSFGADEWKRLRSIAT